MVPLSLIRILVVDDDEAVTNKLVPAIAGAGYDVLSSSDAASAIQHARTSTIHVVLVDLNLASDDGVRLLGQLREAAPAVRLIAIAAFPEAALVVRAMRAGARDLLEKPVNPTAALAAIDRQLLENLLVVRSEDQLWHGIGRRLRSLRAATGKTQSEIAELSGLSPAQYSQIESGKSGTSVWSLLRIAHSLNRPISDLFALA